MEQTQHPSHGIFAKGGKDKKKLRFFFAEPIFAKGMMPKVNIFLRFIFFCGKQHLVPVN